MNRPKQFWTVRYSTARCSAFEALHQPAFQIYEGLSYQCLLWLRRPINKVHMIINYCHHLQLIVNFGPPRLATYKMNLHTRKKKYYSTNRIIIEINVHSNGARNLISRGPYFDRFFFPHSDIVRVFLFHVYVVMIIR